MDSLPHSVKPSPMASKPPKRQKRAKPAGTKTAKALSPLHLFYKMAEFVKESSPDAEGPVWKKDVDRGEGIILFYQLDFSGPQGPQVARSVRIQRAPADTIHTGAHLIAYVFLGREAVFSDVLQSIPFENPIRNMLDLIKILDLLGVFTTDSLKISDPYGLVDTADVKTEAGPEPKDRAGYAPEQVLHPFGLLDTNGAKHEVKHEPMDETCRIPEQLSYPFGFVGTNAFNTEVKREPMDEVCRTRQHISWMEGLPMHMNNSVPAGFGDNPASRSASTFSENSAPALENAVVPAGPSNVSNVGMELNLPLNGKKGKGIVKKKKRKIKAVHGLLNGNLVVAPNLSRNSGASSPEQETSRFSYNGLMMFCQGPLRTAVEDFLNCVRSRKEEVKRKGRARHGRKILFRNNPELRRTMCQLEYEMRRRATDTKYQQDRNELLRRLSLYAGVKFATLRQNLNKSCHQAADDSIRSSRNVQ
ncbi:uncharacterized protein LOC129581761 isoform X2 [Paramacrobiotus metropolitanus]|uniref:uncharacterized protein LOC129581761 isoform X2 n=1 Tax=Paramacrobiotus metropolitanus TaxID=2943436 RepID=UPI002445CFC4|nr:uncharacterized protein LOC129581761 isoform X2 [Paramacrobiotus metropolitanus]